jgi:hypothetical protein
MVMMNLRAFARSEAKPMLRRLLLVLLVAALTAGLTAPGTAAPGGMDCEQVSLQAPAIGCGGEDMAGGVCAFACHAGACIAPSLGKSQFAVKTAQLFARPAARDFDGGRAPDTAPPKHSLA